MSTYLGVSPATCQRLLEALNPVREPASVPLRLPGPAALEQVLAGARKRSAEGGVGLETLALARAGVEQYDQFIRAHARSQRSLLSLIAEHGSVPGMQRSSAEDAGPPGVKQRRALTEAAIAATGESVDVKAIVTLVQPSASLPGMLEISSMVSSVGVRRRGFARPFTPAVLGSWWNAPSNGSGDGPRAASEMGWTLVESMSSVSVKPVLLSKGGGRVALVADFGDDVRVQGDALEGDASGNGGAADPARWRGPADVTLQFLGHAVADPRQDPHARLSLAARIGQPTRLLVLDVLVHSSLVGLGSPVLGVFSQGAPPGDLPGSSPDEHWHERFPEDTRLVLLGGMGGDGARCREHPRQVELVAHLLASQQLDARKFVGFRCLCEFPLWQAEYRMNFLPRGEATTPD